MDGQTSAPLRNHGKALFVGICKGIESFQGFLGTTNGFRPSTVGGLKRNKNPTAEAVHQLLPARRREPWAAELLQRSAGLGHDAAARFCAGGSLEPAGGGPAVAWPPLVRCCVVFV